VRYQILRSIREHAQLLNQIQDNSDHPLKLQKAAEICIKTFQDKGKVLFCGNGGSASDAQHLAAELTGRYLMERDPLFAEALHVNSSYLTAVANDYDFAQIYRRAIKAKGREGDVLVALSTSGNSPNIILALQEAKRVGMTTISFTSQRDVHMKKWSDIYLAIPSDATPRIQEMHILFGHILCDLIEQTLFK